VRAFAAVPDQEPAVRQELPFRVQRDRLQQRKELALYGTGALEPGQENQGHSGVPAETQRELHAVVSGEVVHHENRGHAFPNVMRQEFFNDLALILAGECEDQCLAARRGAGRGAANRRARAPTKGEKKREKEEEEKYD